MAPRQQKGKKTVELRRSSRIAAVRKCKNYKVEKVAPVKKVKNSQPEWSHVAKEEFRRPTCNVTAAALDTVHPLLGPLNDLLRWYPHQMLKAAGDCLEEWCDTVVTRTVAITDTVLPPATTTNSTTTTTTLHSSFDWNAAAKDPKYPPFQPKDPEAATALKTVMPILFTLFDLLNYKKFENDQLRRACYLLGAWVCSVHPQSEELFDAGTYVYYDGSFDEQALIRARREKYENAVSSACK